MFDAKILALVLASACIALAAGDVAEQAKQRNQAYGNELEQYFRDYLVTQYPERAAMAWHRSYENQEAFLKSVEPNRQRYRRMFAPPNLKPTGPLEHKLQPAITGVKAEWISLPLGPIKAEALLV